MFKNFILILFSAVFIAGCNPHMSPEEEIKELIANVENRFEKRQASKLKKYISEDYMDAHGYTKKNLIRFAAGYILRHPNIHVNTRIKNVSFPESDLNAQMELIVAVSNKPFKDTDLRLIQGDFHHFVVRLEKVKKWQIRSLKWQKTTFEDYLDN